MTRVLAVLRSEAFTQISHALPNGDFRHASDPKELLEAIPADSWDAIVVDPTLTGNALTLAALTHERLRVPVFAYIPATPSNLRCVLELAQNGLAGAFVQGFAPDARRLLATLAGLGHRQTAHTVLANLESNLGHLPKTLAPIIQDVFERPWRYEHVNDIACEAHISVRAVYRAFSQARLGTPKKLLRAARILAVYTALRGEDASVCSVSHNARYSSQKTLRKHVRSIFCATPSSLRHVADQNEVLMHVFEWLYKAQPRSPTKEGPINKKGGTAGSSRPSSFGRATGFGN